MTLAGISSVRTPRRCADAVQAHLRSVGREGHEGMGLWVGRRQGCVFEVTDAVIPAQRHIRTADGVCVIVEAAELHRLNVWLFRNKLTLMAQVHSHPGDAYHSGTDDEHAIATTVGCLSLVVPDFASAAFDLRRTATYRLDRGGIWRSLDVPTSSALITVVD